MAITLTSNPAAPAISLLAEEPQPYPITLLKRVALMEREARQQKGWHPDLDHLRDFVGDYLRDAGVEV